MVSKDDRIMNTQEDVVNQNPLSNFSEKIRFTKITTMQTSIIIGGSFFFISISLNRSIDVLASRRIQKGFIRIN